MNKRVRFVYQGSEWNTATIDGVEVALYPGCQIDADPKNEFIAGLIDQGRLIVAPVQPTKVPSASVAPAASLTGDDAPKSLRSTTHDRAPRSKSTGAPATPAPTVDVDSAPKSLRSATHDRAPRSKSGKGKA